MKADLSDCVDAYPGLFEKAFHGLTSSLLPFDFRVDGKKIAVGEIQGTVFSGHATRTTFGNSLRVYLYLRYVTKNISPEHYKIYICGDDGMIKCLAGYVDRLTYNLMNMVYAPKGTKGPYGLGQIAKMVVNLPGTHMEYVSRDMVDLGQFN